MKDYTWKIILTILWVALLTETAMAKNCQTAYEIAETAFEQSKPGKTIGLLKMALQSCPEDTVLNYNLGHAYYENKQPGRAVPYLQKAVQNQPDNPKYLNNLALAMLLSGQRQYYPKALQHARKAYQLDRKAAVADTYINALVTNGEYQTAMQIADQAVRAHSRDTKLVQTKRNAFKVKITLLKNQFDRGHKNTAFEELTDLHNQYNDSELTDEWKKMLAKLIPDSDPVLKPIKIKPWEITTPVITPVYDESLDIDALTAITPHLKEQHPTYALIIGISEYENMKGPQYAAHDADNFKKLLIHTGTLIADDKYCSLLKNKQATVGRMDNALKWLIRKGQEDEDATLIFYFSGHGSPQLAKDNQTIMGGYLLPYEVSKDNIGTKTAMQIAYLDREIGKASNQNILMILDACFSGSGKSVSNQKLAVRAERESIVKSNNTIISAAAADKAADEHPPGKQGLFTYYFIEGLMGPADSFKNGNHDKWVDSYEAFQYAASKLKDMHKRQNPQITTKKRIPLTRVTSK